MEQKTIPKTGGSFTSLNTSHFGDVSSAVWKDDVQFTVELELGFALLQLFFKQLHSSVPHFLIQILMKSAAQSL